MGNFSWGEDFLGGTESETLRKLQLDNLPLASLDIFILQRFVEPSLTSGYVVTQVYGSHSCIFLRFQLVDREQIV